MRRKDREVTERDELIRIMEKCDVCRLALNDEGCPYILPLNFGMDLAGDTITLYFHGANEGKKYELMKRDPRVAFEMDCSHRLVLDEEQGNCTMEYESVIGRGKMEIVGEEDKLRALHILMRHYGREDFPFNQAILPQTTIFKLTVEEMTGKRRMKRTHA